MTARRAFTLVEMLIVIGVILILTTIGVGIATAVVRGAESVQMRSAFNVMDAAFGEWESLTGRPVSYCGTDIEPPPGSSDEMFDVWEPGGTPPGAVTPAAITPSSLPGRKRCCRRLWRKSISV